MTPMRQLEDVFVDPFDKSSTAYCPSCNNELYFNYPLSVVRSDIARIMLSKKFQKLDIIDIDGVGTPVLKKKVSTTDNKYFASIQINESKRGPQLVIYAGKRGYNNKSQIFITPETKKMSFDHNDIMPTDIFTKVTAEFVDGTANEIRGKNAED
jgi:hypothetical protein